MPNNNNTHLSSFRSTAPHTVYFTSKVKQPIYQLAKLEQEQLINQTLLSSDEISSQMVYSSIDNSFHNHKTISLVEDTLKRQTKPSFVN